jgi:hypothetical protein
VVNDAVQPAGIWLFTNSSDDSLAWEIVDAELARGKANVAATIATMDTRMRLTSAPLALAMSDWKKTSPREAG